MHFAFHSENTNCAVLQLIQEQSTVFDSNGFPPTVHWKYPLTVFTARKQSQNICACTMQKLLQTLTVQRIHSKSIGYIHHCICHVVKQDMQLWLKQKSHISDTDANSQLHMHITPHAPPYMYFRSLCHQVYAY